MIRILLVCILLTVCELGHAQVSGYQGKLFSTTVSFSSFPGVFAVPVSAAKESGASRGDLALFSFHKRIELHANCVLSRKLAVGLSLKKQQSAALIREAAYAVSDMPPIYGTDLLYFELVQNPIFNTLHVGVSVDTYLSGYIAPLGRFVRLEYGRIFYSLKDEDQKIRHLLQPPPTNLNTIEMEAKGSISYLGLSYNTSKIFLNRIIVSVGMEGNLVLRFRDIPSLNTNAFLSREELNDVASHAAQMNIRGQNLITLRVGLGLLIF